MSIPPIITVTLLVDQDHYYISADVEGVTYELGHYANVNDGAQRMNDFIHGHGYEWAKDSARRVDEAQRRDAKILILDAVPGIRALNKHPDYQAWHHADYYPYIHVAHRMGL